MKVVLFCGGFGMRMREHSEALPKPMVAIGYRPILWHVMKYYAHYGHEAILCLGYKADVIKKYFLEYNECVSNDFVLPRGGKSLKLLSSDIQDWDITFVDTGLTSNVGQRLKAVQRQLEGEQMFLANYADGLSDVPLPAVIESFKKSENIACFVSVKPRASFHLITMEAGGGVTSIEHIAKSGARINGGFMVLRQEIFSYMKDGEEPTTSRWVGGTVLRMIERSKSIEFYWLVLSSNPKRGKEAESSANAFLRRARKKTVVVKSFRDGFLPYLGPPVKECFEELKKVSHPM